MKYTRIKVLKKMFPYIGEDKRKCVYVLMVELILLLCPIVTPYFYYTLIDDVIVNRDISRLSIVFIGYIVIFGIQALAKVFKTSNYNTLFGKLQLKLRTTILKKIFYTDYEQVSQYEMGDLYNRSDKDIEAIQSFIREHIIAYSCSCISLVVIAIILCIMDWRLTLFGLVMGPLSFFITKFMVGKAKHLNDEYRKIYGDYETFLYDTFQNWKHIKADNLQQRHNEMMQSYWDKLSKLFIKKHLCWFINRSFIAFKDLFITRMSLYFFGGILIINGRLEIAILLTFMNYYEEFYGHIEKVIQSVFMYKSELPIIERIMEILEIEDEKKIVTKIASDKLVVRDVKYRYNQASHLALDGISLDVDESTHVAIVGKSGCGKTTLAKLLVGLIRPTDGVIQMGGYDTSSMPNYMLNKKISIVTQEPYMFNLSIKENLLIAKSDARDEEIEVACKKANINQFICQLPDKYETVIGEKGIKLSGGQRQRIAIATEKTLITIAHRLSAVIHANRVIVMEEGKIANIGTHQSLMYNDVTYQTLFKAQYQM